MKIQNLLTENPKTNAKNLKFIVSELMSAGFIEIGRPGGVGGINGNLYTISDDITGGGFKVQVVVASIGDNIKLDTENTFTDRYTTTNIDASNKKDITKFIKNIKKKLSQMHDKMIENVVKEKRKTKEFKIKMKELFDLGFKLKYDFFGKDKGMLRRTAVDDFYPMRIKYRGYLITSKLRGSFTLDMFSSHQSEGYVFQKASDVKAVIDLFIERDM